MMASAVQPLPNSFTRRCFFKIALAAVPPAAVPPAWALDVVPLVRRTPPKKVAVLGAGLAGLVAAYELRNAGHHVTLFEAQLRPGGRVQTIRDPLSDGMYAEAGAGRIPSTHSVTLRWARHFGLQLEPFYPTTLASVAVLRGTRIITPIGQRINMSRVPLELTQQERSVGLSDLSKHYFGRLKSRIGEAIDCRWSKDILELGDVSFANYLRRVGASNDAIRYLSGGFEEDAVLDALRDSVSHDAPLSKIRGGNDRLPRAFAAKLADRIRYGAVVECIDRRDKLIRICYRQAATPQQFDADEVICTIPFSVLRHIDVRPAWQSDKQRAIEHLTYGSVVRMTYQTRTRFWEREGLNGFGSSDAPFEVWNPSFNKPGRRGLLQAYLYEDFARRVSSMNDEERERTMIAAMEGVHPGLKAELEGIVTKSWDKDPWQRGAFTLYMPGEQSLYSAVCRREGNVLFAGEHASPWPGWIQGALLSGMKAAREVNGWRPRNYCDYPLIGDSQNSRSIFGHAC